jgi:flavin-dependent dehydrogenase
MNIEDSVKLAEAGRRDWPVVVVGAGPAGSFLARSLARAGVEVLLIDRAHFPRWKVCGCCLNGAALSILESAGLGKLPSAYDAVPLSRVRLGAAGRWADLALPVGVSLSREVLDAALVRTAMEEGVEFLGGTTARLLSLDGSASRTVRLRQQGEECTITARVLIAADGLGGQFLAGEQGHVIERVADSRIGAGAVTENGPKWFEPGTIYMACAPGGYVGLVRLEDGRLDLAAALDLAFVRQRSGVADAVAEIIGSSGWPGTPELDGLTWRGTPALTRQTVTPGGERYFVVGDAAGYVEPFTGEGVAWALLSASALAPLVVSALQHWDARLVSEWRRRLRQLLGRRRLVCRMLIRLLRHPLLTLSLVRLLGWMPILARPIIAELNRSPRILTRPTSKQNGFASMSGWNAGSNMSYDILSEGSF